MLGGRTRALGAGDPRTLATRFELAGVLARQGRLGDAEAEYRVVLAAQTTALGAGDRSTLVSRFELAGVLARQGQLGDAEAEYRAVLAAEAWPAEDPSTLAIRLKLAGVLARQGGRRRRGRVPGWADRQDHPGRREPGTLALSAEDYQRIS